jgi:hypothetical protein
MRCCAGLADLAVPAPKGSEVSGAASAASTSNEPWRRARRTRAGAIMKIARSWLHFGTPMPMPMPMLRRGPWDTKQSVPHSMAINEFARS